MYRTAEPPTWDPLPQCQHVKLAMIKEKGKRCGSDNTIAESRVEGDVDKLLTIKVPVDSDRIFDAGIFDDERQVILVEGGGGMGKTSLAYQYAKKWAEGKLSTFDAVALVRLRDLNEHDVCEVDCIMPHLLFLASGTSISKEMAQLIVDKKKILLILDGWDESRFCKLSFIKDLLQSVSPQTRILITSRPDYSLDLHGLANRIEILGLTEDNIHYYLEIALKLSHNTDTPLPTTMSQLFDALTRGLIDRHLVSTRQVPIEYYMPPSLQHRKDISKLPSLVAQQFLQLAKVAYESICTKKHVFTNLGEDFEHLGTMEKMNVRTGPGYSYTFLHSGLQEYLTALHIAIMNPSGFELVEWLQNHNGVVRSLVGILFHHDDYHSHPLYQKINQVYQNIKTTRDGSQSELRLAELVIDEVYPYEAELLIHAQGEEKMFGVMSFLTA